MADYKHFTKNQGRFRNIGCFNPSAVVRSINDWRENRQAAISDRLIRKGKGDWKHSAFRGRLATGKQEAWCLVTVKPVRVNGAKAVLQSMKEMLGELPFIPLFMKINNSGILSFYLQDKATADALVATSNKALTEGGKGLSIWKRIATPPFAPLDGAQCELVKTVLMKRCDTRSQRLNLRNFGGDESFIEYRVNFPLNRPAVSLALVDILWQNATALVEIDLSCNSFRVLDHVANFLFCLPNVTRLDLSGNMINSLEELRKLSCWNLVALSLKDNPVVGLFKQKRQAYVRHLLEIFPLLKTLDDREISSEAVLPQYGVLKMKGSYVVNESIKTMIASFLRDYYAVFDGDKKNRVELMKAYEVEQSLLTVSLNTQTSQQKSNICLNKRWKGLVRYNHELMNIETWHYRRDCLEFSGNMSITCFLKERIPEMKHDLNSFLVDLVILEGNIAVCSISGYFKDPLDPTNNVKEFGRVLILEERPAGLVILNDMTYFCATTAHAYGDHMACLQKLNVQYQQSGTAPSSEQLSQDAVIGATTTPFSNDLIAQGISKEAMIAEMTKVTGMKPSWAAKCLEDNSWQFQLACNNFISLRDSGVIPSDAFN